MVGDTWMDVAAGRGAGCRTIILGPDALDTELQDGGRADHAVADLDAAASIVVAGTPSVSKPGGPGLAWGSMQRG